MDTEATREQEFLDHQLIMEKLRQLTAKCDTLFALYERTPQDLTAHNLDATAHPAIRRTITTLDERENDHYSEVTDNLDTVNTTLTTAINDEVNARVAENNTIHTELTAATNNITSMQTGNYSYSVPLTSSVQSRTYINANKGITVVNSTASAGFNMLYRVKSSNGVYTGGAYNQKYILNYTDDSTVNNGTNKVVYTTTLMDESGNAAFANNVTIKGSLTAASITGTLDTKAPTAALADKATLADQATNASTAVRANTADVAILANDATHADRATLADTATVAVRAQTAAVADLATNATNAVNADKATQATNAKNATKADLAVRATDADNATHAYNADAATRATLADNATVATYLGGLYTKDDVTKIVNDVNKLQTDVTDLDFPQVTQPWLESLYV